MTVNKFVIYKNSITNLFKIICISSKIKILLYLKFLSFHPIIDHVH